MGSRELPYTRLHPRPDTIHISQGRTVFETDADGWITGETAHGLFVYQTRMLSKYRWLIDGEAPRTNAVSNVQQHSWLGYYLSLPAGARRSHQDEGSGQMEEVSEHTLELRIARYVGDGVHEDVDLCNYTQRRVTISLTLEIDADFAGREELNHGRRAQQGELRKAWKPEGVLDFDYRAEHRYDHQGERGVAGIHRGLEWRVRADTQPQRRADSIDFAITLQPLERWHACVDITARVEATVLAPVYSCRSFATTQNVLDRKREQFLQSSTEFAFTHGEGLAPVVAEALQTAGSDLASLRLHDLDRSEKHWTMAAGLPVYIALFGRDTLTTAWQAALAGPEMMLGTLREVADWQGREDNPWRDEQPGRMLHEAHTDPLAALHFNPRSRYYGAITTSAFYPVAVSELWHWTGNLDLVYPMLKPALDALQWLDRATKLRGDGFHYYRSRSEQGNVNQGWKDSREAIVREDGRLVEPPIATSEEQGFVYAAKFQLSELLWWIGRKDEARRLFAEAGDLKKRFNGAYWMEDQRFYAMALDQQRQQVRAIGSNPGHCLATGIVETDRAGDVAQRLMKPDMYSGWGVRTLSSRNPAYNPYSYHRGSVWPVENGTFAISFFRYGMWNELHRLARGMFDASVLYDFRRLPEVFAGHPRDDDHPFPGIYPRANWPQAWSASAMFCIVQALLGLYPYAPLKILMLDPHLPAWLPELTLKRLRIGTAAVDIRFFRKPDGSSDYEVLDKRGELHILRQPSPWSLTANFAERVKDALTSLVH